MCSKTANTRPPSHTRKIPMAKLLQALIFWWQMAEGVCEPPAHRCLDPPSHYRRSRDCVTSTHPQQKAQGFATKALRHARQSSPTHTAKTTRWPHARGPSETNDIVWQSPWYDSTTPRATRAKPLTLSPHALWRPSDDALASAVPAPKHGAELVYARAWNV